LKKIIFDEKIRRLHIIGISGIGKAFFFYYLLYQLARQIKQSYIINIVAWQNSWVSAGSMSKI